MPTLSQISLQGDTDIGWGVVSIVAHDPETMAPSLVSVECKACRAVQYVQIVGDGHQFGAFDHRPDCKVLREIAGHARETRQAR
jgi:hypothetical protein